MGHEIQSAIQVGKEVTFHERGINAHGFSGYGYIITDPETGAGAYMIEGKGNGGNLLFEPDGLKVMRFFSIGAPPTTVDPLALNATYAFGVVAVYSAINTVSELWSCYQDVIKEIALTIVVVLAVAAIAAALTGGAGLAGGGGCGTGNNDYQCVGGLGATPVFSAYSSSSGPGKSVLW